MKTVCNTTPCFSYQLIYLFFLPSYTEWKLFFHARHVLLILVKYFETKRAQYKRGMVVENACRR